MGSPFTTGLFTHSLLMHILITLVSLVGFFSPSENLVFVVSVAGDSALLLLLVPHQLIEVEGG